MGKKCDRGGKMTGLKRGTVELHTHERRWEQLAEETIMQLRELFGDMATDIQHVGSTAIWRIRAKPILDIAVAVRDLAAAMQMIPGLETAGFRVAQPEADGLLLVLGDFEQDTVTHHIHVVQSGGERWLNYLAFRDYLNASAAAAENYERVKLRLLEQYAGDRASYTAGKEEFIRGTLRWARIWSYLGMDVTVEIDETEPVLCGHLAGLKQRVYVMGAEREKACFEGWIVGVIHREDDSEDMLVAAPKGTTFHQAEIEAAVHTIEQYHKITIDTLLRKSCGAILYRLREGKPEYLMLLQKKSKTWSFAKGHMEVGETEEQAAVREVLEETGNHVTLREGFCETVEYPVSPRTRKRVVLFLAEMEHEPCLQEAEICSHRWVSAEEMKTMLRNVIAPAIDRAEAYLA